MENADKISLKLTWFYNNLWDYMVGYDKENEVLKLVN